MRCRCRYPVTFRQAALLVCLAGIWSTTHAIPAGLGSALASTSSQSHRSSPNNAGEKQQQHRREQEDPLGSLSQEEAQLIGLYNNIDSLKAGDERAWQTYGPLLVDLVNAMLETDMAVSPVDALIRIFWPDLSEEQQKSALDSIEPSLVRSTDLWLGLPEFREALRRRKRSLL